MAEHASAPTMSTSACTHYICERPFANKAESSRDEPSHAKLTPKSLIRPRFVMSDRRRNRDTKTQQALDLTPRTTWEIERRHARPKEPRSATGARSSQAQFGQQGQRETRNVGRNKSSWQAFRYQVSNVQPRPREIIRPQEHCSVRHEALYLQTGLKS